MPFPLETLLLVPLLVFGAFVAFGVTGFGSTILALPLIALLLPIKFAIPMFVLLDFAAALRQGLKFRDTIAKDELAWLLPFMVAGVVMGVLIFVRMPAAWLAVAMGLFVLGYGLHLLRGREPRLRLTRRWAIPTGLVGGTVAALFGAAGPLFVMYLNARGLDATRLRSTMAVVFVVSTGARIVLFALTGAFAQDWLLVTAAALAIPMLAGLWVGHHLHVTLPRTRLLQVMGVVLTLSGGSLLASALR
ncbi:MAG: sulfite exporter TauE/SafE family protein [Burkholderiales bacterium]